MNLKGCVFSPFVVLSLLTLFAQKKIVMRMPNGQEQEENCDANAVWAGATERTVIRLGLDSIRYLCEKLNNPQDKLQFIHIAGTNGKGSTGAYISSILKCAGYKVGWYSSPAVFKDEEIIKVNNRSISKASYKEGMAIIDKACEELWPMGKDINGVSPATEFERQTALAFRYFEQKKCDIVVLECGMGGLTDATNIVKNTKVCVFTSISLDHTDYLGDTVEDIAKVKSGIMKPGCRVVSLDNGESVNSVIRHEASLLTKAYDSGETVDITNEKAGKNAEAHGKPSVPVDLIEPEKSLKKFLALKGKEQLADASLAYHAVKALPSDAFTISEKSIAIGLHNTVIEGRFEIISKAPTIIIDGAHNPGAAIALKESLEEKYSGRHIIAVVGMLKNKDHDEVLKTVLPLAATVLTVSTGPVRAFSAEDLARVALKYHPSVTSIGGIEEAMDMSMLLAQKNDVIVVFGSFSFLKEVKKWNDMRK